MLGTVCKTVWCNSPTLLSQLCFTPDRKQKEALKSGQPLFRAGPMTKTIPSNSSIPTSDCNSLNLSRTNGKSHCPGGLEAYQEPMAKTVLMDSSNPFFAPDQRQKQYIRIASTPVSCKTEHKQRHRNPASPCFAPDQ